MANERALSDAHRRALVEDSGISEKVVADRGYETVTSAARLKRIGFSASQASVPALLVPVWSCSGEIVLYQSRPDEPRIKDGKRVKYETMAGATMSLDVHPHARPLLANPNVPLFITEGIKKGDALVSRGCCAIALLGVWNWRGTNEFGGKTALADWESIALNGRRVYIVFDSDVMLKPEVHSALARLKTFVESRGASC